MKKLGMIRDPRLRIKRPIGVIEIRMGKELLLWNRAIGHFGAGRSFGEAAEDFARSLPDLYWFLHDNQDRLGPGLMEYWKFAQVYIGAR